MASGSKLLLYKQFDGVDGGMFHPRKNQGKKPLTAAGWVLFNLLVSKVTEKTLGLQQNLLIC